MKYTQSQKTAIDYEGENILVSASAGSGKTGVLKARVLRKINDGVDIDRLIILTFTEAAAAEMKSRIIDELNKQGLDEQLIKLDNAIISTFDAFTLRLVKTYHYLLNLPADISISDHLLIQMQSQAICEDVVKSFYQEARPDFIALVKRLFSGNDNFLYTAIESLAKAIKKIPNHQHILDQYDDIYNDQMAKDAYLAYFQMIHEDLKRLAYKHQAYVDEQIGRFSEACDDYLHACQTIYENLGQAKEPDQLIRLLEGFSLPKKPRKPRDEEVWLESNEHVKKQVINIQKEIRDARLTSDHYLDTWQETQAVTHVLLDMVKVYLKRMQSVQKEKNLYSFDDIMAFAIQLFEDNHMIRNHYKDQINEILIDEYQDTNDLQDYFISLIANDNIFMVGDVKQSIYRFRDANPKNFMRLLEKYQNQDGGKAIRLLENFRSNRFLLEAINQFFLKKMTPDTGGVDYRDNHQLVSGYDETFGLNLKNDPIHHHYYDLQAILDKHPDLSKDEIEAHIIANDIKRKIDQRQAVFDGQKSRSIDYDDITILVDRKTAFKTYAKILSNHGIPVEIYDKTMFSESEEIIFLTQYLKVLQGIRNGTLQGLKTALYAVARSFVYQIPDQDIIHFFVHHQGRYKDLQESLSLKAIYEDLKSLVPFVDHIPNMDLLTHIYQRLHLYEKVAYLENAGSKSKKLDFFYGLIQGQKDQSFDDLIAYLDFIQNQNNVDIEYKEERHQFKALKLMSIHQSKGLQFPVIYMLGLHKKFNFQENKEPFNFSKDYGILTYAFHDGIYRHYLERLYFKRLKQEDISEKIRLMYVALTRAKEEINFVLEAKASLSLDKLSATNYLEMLYDGYDLEPKDLIRHILMPQAQKQQNIQVNAKEIHYKHFDFKTELSDSLSFSKKETFFFTDEEKEALAFGETIHERLEDIDFLDLDTSIKNLPVWLQESIRHLSQSPLFKDLKKPKFFYEYEFLEEKDGAYGHGIIDLLIEDQDQIIILDYKLKDIDDPAYQKQILAYKTYIESISQKPVRGYIYSLKQRQLKHIV